MFVLKYQNLPNNQIFEILGVFSASIRFIPSASRIIGSLQLLRYATPSMDVVLKENIISDNEFEGIIKKQKNVEEFIFDDSIKLNNVNFTFKNQKEIILQDVNLELKKNEIIGIYGQSGSGKSTIVDLICGLLKPTSGSNKKWMEKTLEIIFSWRKKIGYVTQNTYLIDDTIKNNIILGDPKNFDASRFENSIRIKSTSRFC